MDLLQYQKLAARTINRDLDGDSQLAHTLLGLSAETGELCGLYQKMYQGHVLDEEHLKKETGDILWFVAKYCTIMGWNMGEIAQLNIDKLKERFPNGFEKERSIHRAKGDI